MAAVSQEAYHAIITALPHRLRVMRMYRYGLRELLNWSSNRHEWFPRAKALRMEFEANKGLVR
jgi:NADH dehydrogenase (ubiquinone) 1 beta subcomplex subunit 9